jgi:hypothetical protein
MFSALNKYKNNGHFFFKKGNSLKEVSHSVPNSPGVYYFIRLARGRVELVYIGKSGSILQNGKFIGHGLQAHLNNIQEEINRQEFFDLKFNQEQIDGLDIYWFVTYDKTNHDLPGYIEGLIMQLFFEVHGSLPDWNKEY